MPVRFLELIICAGVLVSVGRMSLVLIISYVTTLFGEAIYCLGT